MAKFHLRCSECGAILDEDPSLLTCPDCSRNQQRGNVTRGVLEVVLEHPPARWPDDTPASAPFLEAFLPLSSADNLAPIPVGGTPLLRAARLRSELGMEDLWIKDDTRNPSGSTKDRASLLVVAKAGEYGFDTIATASTGNAATALACISAVAGIRAVVFVPATAPPAKLVQMLSYGAVVIPVDGTYDDAFELCLSACKRFGWYNRNTALNPYTVEGKKTAALEIARALAPEVPDAVLVPTGDGVILAGVAKGFCDLVAAGLTDRVPRLIAVQPEGSPAIVRALGAGTPGITPVPDAASVADSLTVQAPRNALLCLRRIRETGGGGLTVSDDAMVAAISRLARTTGVFAEPAAAAALAGLEAAIDRGLVTTSERVVLLITGSGLKDIPAAARALTTPAPVPPLIDAVAERLGDHD